MDKYWWSFDRFAEIWHESGNTVKECIDQARELNDGTHLTVFIGESVPFIPSQHLNIDCLLDDLHEQACDFAGEVAEDWDPYDYKKKAELQELREAIGSVVDGWLKKYDRYPTFAAIENVAEYDLNKNL